MNKNIAMQEVFDTLNDNQKKIVYALVGYVIKTRRIPSTIIHYETGNVYCDFVGDPYRDVFDALTDIQKECVDAIVRYVYKHINTAFMIGEDWNFGID